MATPIPPQSVINTVVLGTITVQYAPTWDGAAWVINPNTVRVSALGHATDDGVEVSPSTALVPFNDLPQGAKDALNQLYGYMEAAIATNFS